MNQTSDKYINGALFIILVALCGFTAWNLFHWPEKFQGKQSIKKSTVVSQKKEVLSGSAAGSKDEEDPDPEVPVSEESLEQIPEETVKEEITTGKPVEEIVPPDEKTTEEGLILEDEPAPVETPQQAEKYPALPTSIDRDPSVLKVGFITDLHIKSTIVGTTRQISQTYRDKVYYFNSQMARSFAPDFIIINGDSIEGTKQPAEVGMEELRLTKKEFDVTGIPKHWVLGNHELRSVTKQQYKDALGITYTNTAFDNGNYRIIILDSNFTAADNDVSPGHQYLRGNVPNWEREWLREQLSTTDKIKVVFIHHPPLTEIDTKRKVGLLFRAELLEDIFDKYDVKAVFSGHVEVLFREKKDGVYYYGLPGLAKHTSYQGAFATIEIRSDKVTVKMTYLDNDGKYRTIDVK